MFTALGNYQTQCYKWGSALFHTPALSSVTSLEQLSCLPGRFIGKLASKLLTDGAVHRPHPSSPFLRHPSLTVLWVTRLAGCCVLSPSLQQSFFSSSPSQLIDLSILSLPPLSPIFYSISSPSRLRLRLPESPRQFWGKLG